MMLWRVEEVWNLTQAGFKFDMMTMGRKVIRIDRAWSVTDQEYVYDCICEDGTRYIRFRTASIFADVVE